MCDVDIVIVFALFILEGCFLWLIWEQHKTIMSLLRTQGEDTKHLRPLWALISQMTPDKWRIVRRRKAKSE